MKIYSTFFVSIGLVCICIGLWAYLVDKPLVSDRDRYKTQYEIVLKERDEMTSLADSLKNTAITFKNEAETLLIQFRQLQDVTEGCILKLRGKNVNTSDNHGKMSIDMSGADFHGPVQVGNNGTQVNN